MDGTLAILILLILLSGFFSSSEIALTALTAAKVRSMENDGKLGSKPILKLKKHPQRLLIAVLVNNQAINIIATAVATVWAIHQFGENAVTLVTFIFTVVLISFGAIFPKTLALRFPEVVARSIAYPLLGFIMITRPVVWIFELMTKGLLALMKAKKRELPSTSAGELEAMLDISAEQGVLEKDEESYLKHVLRFSKTKVEDIMTLLKDIQAIPIDIENEELRKYIKDHDHERFPVYEDDMNDIKGIAYLHDIIEHAYERNKNHPFKNFSFKRLIVVPHTTSITELLKELKDKQQTMSLVVDEHGQTVGIVTMEDILEEIAGASLEPGKRKTSTIEKDGKNSWNAKGETTITEIEEALDITLDYPKHQPISLVILEELKRFPDSNETIELDGINVDIKYVDRTTIKSVVIHKNRSKKSSKKK